jgi:sugar lactone lactonase YvrE
MGTASGSDASVLIGGLDFGEGPRWHDDRLWYSDFYRHGVFTVTASGEREQVVELDDHPSGLGWLPDGRLLVVAMKSRTVRRREHDGSISVHADLSGIASGRCNDMVVAADGTAYVGNFGSDVWSGEPMRPAVLARVRPDGRVDAVADDLAFPNGTVITPDGSTLIVGESMGRRYTAFDVQADGTLANRRVWAELPGVGPDGCTLDADGAIWCADALGGNVLRVLEGGVITHRVDAGQNAYACALGGADGRTLFMVCADSPREEDAAGSGTGTIRTVRVDVPHAGLP